MFVISNEHMCTCYLSPQQPLSRSLSLSLFGDGGLCHNLVFLLSVHLKTLAKIHEFKS